MDGISGSPHLLQFGKRSAWTNFVLFLVYALTVITGLIQGQGILIEPYLTIAEILTLVGAPLLILLMVAIHACTPTGAKIYSLMALGWMLLLAGFTMTVHFVNLTFGKQISSQEKIDFVRFVGWEWPSMLYAVELLAWHLFFGLAVFFAAFAFKGSGKEKIVKTGLLITGLLCMVGLMGPLMGDLRWRLPGIFGYGILFPIVCAFIAGVFKNAQVVQGK